MNNDIFDCIKKTFEDEKLSSSEKKALLMKIEESGLDSNKRNLLRARIFDFAREKAEGQANIKIIDWLESVNKLLVTDIPAVKENVFFSPGTGCRNQIVDLIKNTSSSLLLCVFTITDNRISDEIIRAHKRGVEVKIITDDDKSHDFGSDIMGFSEAGIKVKIDNSSAHMHHKFAIFDGQTALTGSYNWTKSAFEENQENILVTDSAIAIEKYLAEFNKLWSRMTDY